MRSPALKLGRSIRRPHISPSVRNMPVDAIITSVMVRIMIGSKSGRPKWKGRMSANHSASPTRSKCMSPSAAAAPAPKTIPASTETLDRNPRAKRHTSTIVSSTSPEIAMFCGVA